MLPDRCEADYAPEEGEAMRQTVCEHIGRHVAQPNGYCRECGIDLTGRSRASQGKDRDEA